MGIRLIAIAVLLLLTTAASGADEDYAGRRGGLEQEFAPRYMDIAEHAKRYHARELTERAYRRAEALAPGLDAVITFDPEVEGRPRHLDARRVEKLAAELADLESREAKAHLALARWCNDEALLDESVREAVAALTLAPGPVAFDEEGVLREPLLGRLPLDLSLSVLDEHEVYAGRLVPREAVPGRIPWGKGWSLSTRHYDLKSNVSGRLVRVVGRALEAARAIYSEMTGFDVKRRITVYVVANRKQYERLWAGLGKEAPAADNVGKCYRDFCGVDGSHPEREVVSVAIHEVAHGYLNLGLEALTGTRGATMPTWYHEGLATYCAGYGPDSLSFDRGVVRPGIAKERPLARFRQLLAAGEARPLKEFLKIEEGDSAFYYQAFAFFWFWYEVEDPELKAGFRRAVAAMEKAALGKDRNARGYEIFVREIGVPLPKIQEGFFAWARAGAGGCGQRDQVLGK
jgi:hypothetical protein